MTSSIISHLHFGGADISLWKKFRLFFTVGVVVLLLSAAKVAVHYFGFEFLDLNGLLTSGIGGAVFIVGFLLSSILQDYKEAEKIPADLRNSIEAIEGDLACFAQTNDAFDLRKARLLLLALIDRLREGLGHKNVPPALDELAKLTPILGRLEGMGMAANFVVRLRTNQDVIRRALLRIYTIQRVEFVPSVHVLVQTLVFSIVLLLLLLKTEGDPASALLFGFITFMFVYVLYLVRLLEQPFAKGHGSVDDVSFFLLDELERNLRRALEDPDGGAQNTTTTGD
ncbi:MAG TPA: hypothetical protein VNK51_19330 [Bradyrhizobium sp.]|uniref:hypothetical protein n=1 Tax=Bradyrhizobium sp. CCH5-F6 TaxID=1768753 RepID=UPI00076A34C4|nr:hypothetical protein [Bradyrhizobium sp. CCH5-F6]TKW77219.1 MAG: hypothetical protein DI543_16860 [Bradyrhizobium icense]HXH45978.1 hypothetical protein [Bradyrhizobium sp.]